MSDTDVAVVTKTKIKQPSLWKVVMLNDDYTPIDFVVYVLMRFFSKTVEESNLIAQHIHERGKAQVGLYTREVAELKVSTVTAFAEQNGHPLQVIAEEA